MKYLITESKLEKVIFRYLDIQDFHVTRHNNNDYNFWDRRDYENGILTITISTHKQINCFIQADFTDSVSSLFSLERYDTINIIGDWVESKTGFEFKNIF